MRAAGLERRTPLRLQAQRTKPERPRGGQKVAGPVRRLNRPSPVAGGSAGSPGRLGPPAAPPSPSRASRCSPGAGEGRPTRSQLPRGGCEETLQRGRLLRVGDREGRCPGAAGGRGRGRGAEWLSGGAPPATARAASYPETPGGAGDPWPTPPGVTSLLRPQGERAGVLERQQGRGPGRPGQCTAGGSSGVPGCTGAPQDAPARSRLQTCLLLPPTPSPASAP